MHYTPYRQNSGSWIGGLVSFIIGIMAITFIVVSMPSATAQTTKISRIEYLEQSVKELYEKNLELEERLNYMSDSLGTTVELVDRLEAKVGL